MAQKQVKQEDLEKLALEIAEKLQCFRVAFYDHQLPSIDEGEIASICKPVGDIEVDGFITLTIPNPEKIPFSLGKFQLDEIAFNNPCKHLDEDEQWWLVVRPGEMTFFWSNECRECSSLVVEMLDEAGFTEVPEPNGEE